MKINELYDTYKDRPVKRIDAETKDNILASLSSINSINDFNEAEKFIKVLALCRGAQAAMDGEKRNNTLRTLLSTGEEGAYVDNDSYINERFMYELIQNVDDCKYASPDDCKLAINFDVDKDIIKLEYNELGFRPKDVIAISDIGNSTKNHHKSLDQKETGLDKQDLQEIGEKGIGFKSIFGLANNVVIESGYFKFYFDYSDFTIPKVYESGNRNKINGTKLTIQLKKGITSKLYKMLKDNYKSNENLINENPVLFLNKLTEIKYVSKTGYFGFRATRHSNTSIIDGERMKIEYISSNKREERSIDCFRYAKEVRYTVDECKSRFGKDEDSERTYKIEIVTAADLNNKFNGRIYSYFPTAQELTVPMIIHAPFKLDSGRTNIATQSSTFDSGNLWFTRTKNETISFIKHVLEDLADKMEYKIVNFVPEDNLVDSRKCPLYDSRLSKSEILKLCLFQSITGDYYPASELCVLNYDQMSIKRKLDIDEAIEIYNLLNINIPLLNKVVTERSTRNYGFIMINDIDNRLFQTALTKKQYTESSLKYLKSYIPNTFKTSTNYMLTNKQVFLFSKYPSIIKFINHGTFEYLKNKNGIIFKVDTLPNMVSKELGEIREYCLENDDQIEDKLYNYISNVQFVNSSLYENTIYLQNCIFGSDIIDAANNVFREVNEKYKNFFSLMKTDQIEKNIDSLITDDSCSNQKFLKEITDYRKSQMKILGRQYKKILELINQSGTKSDHFLMELLQNIDDCEYDEEPSVEFDLSDNILTITYNEVGFKKENVASITAIGDSTKQYLTTESITGEKGIGFKSIFNGAQKVEIHSNDFHFYLTGDEPTIPKKIKLAEKYEGTKMIISLKNGYLDNYFNEKYFSKICLCLRKVKHLRFNDQELFIQDFDNRRIIKGEKIHEYYKFIYYFNVNNTDLLKERYDNKQASNKQTITYLIPKEQSECFIYSTFPTIERVKVPVSIDANFKLNTSRESLLSSDEWNIMMNKEVHEGFLWMLNQLKTVDYKKLADVIPYNGYLTANLSYYYKLKNKIIKEPIFKIFNTNRFVSLEYKFIANDLDKYILKKWGCQNKNYRDDCIDFDESKITDCNFYIEPDFADRCKDLSDKNSYNVIKSECLKDNEFRKLLYDYLREKCDACFPNQIRLTGIKNWNIIPVLNNGQTEYVKYSEKICYDNENTKSISNKVMILDQGKMDVETFDIIYKYVQYPSKRKTIQQYSSNVLLDDMVQQIEQCLESDDKCTADKLLELYESDKSLFKDCIEKRGYELNFGNLAFASRKRDILNMDQCYLPYENQHNVLLDYAIIDDKYLELAELVGVKSVKDIDYIADIYEYFNYDNLNELLSLNYLQNNTTLFDNIFHFMHAYNYEKYIKDEVFLKLARKLDLNDSPLIEKFIPSINKLCLENYGKDLINLFLKVDGLKFKLDEDIKLADFEYEILLNDMRNDLQARKNDDRISTALSLINNCYYVDKLSYSLVPIRLEDKDVLLVNQNITSEYDIISEFKEFFSQYFRLELNVNRDAERYTRDYFEEISTIDYDSKEETIATRMASRISQDNISQVKDFMCKPLDINGKIIGGYARTCPLCGAKVYTELTGMRLFKFKKNDYMYELISCANCYENFRYSSELVIDEEDFENNYLTLKAYVNGEEWKVKHKKIRLGHKAILNVLNERLKK